MKSLDQIIRELPSERRAKIAERADQLIAEEVASKKKPAGKQQ